MSQQEAIAPVSDQNVQNGHGWSSNGQQQQQQPSGATAAAAAAPPAPPSPGGERVGKGSPGNGVRSHLRVPVEDAARSHPILPGPRSRTPSPSRRQVLERLCSPNVSGARDTSAVETHSASKTELIYRIVALVVLVGALACLAGVCSPFWFRSVGALHAWMGPSGAKNVTYWGLWEVCVSGSYCIAPLKFKSNLMTFVRVLAVMGTAGYTMSSIGFIMGLFRRCYVRICPYFNRCLLLMSAAFMSMTAILYASVYHPHVTQKADFFLSFYLVLGASLVAMVAATAAQMAEHMEQHDSGRGVLRLDVETRSDNRSPTSNVESRSDNRSPGSRDTVREGAVHEERQPLVDHDSLAMENQMQGAGVTSVIVHVTDDAEQSGELDQPMERDAHPERLTGPVPQDLSDVRTGLEMDAEPSDGQH